MPKNKQQEAQEKRLQKNIRQAKKTGADAKQGKTKSARSKPSKKGGFFAGLKADAPQTVQQSIPYREMYRDGICRLTDTLYTKTVQFFDINYQLAQADDKAQIFEGYCDFLNYFDASIHVQLTFINQRANMQDFTKSIDIPPRGDEYDGIRKEYGDMLKNQLQKGNNGLTKRKYISDDNVIVRSTYFNLKDENHGSDMSMKTKSAKYAKMRRGEYQSVICPYGYRKSADGRMEPDEDVAPNVQMIFQWASEGNTAAEITRKLYAMNIPTPGEYRKLKGKDYYNVSRTNGVWSTSTVLRILEDQRYIGTYVIGKRKVKEIGSRHTQLKDESEWFKIPNHHPAIVSVDLFEKANASIKRFSLSNKKPRDYLLRGKVFCGCCDHAMSLRNGAWFYCRHSEVAETLPCHGVRIKMADLEQVVFETIRAQMCPALGIDSNKDKLDLQTVQQAEHEEKLRSIQDSKRHLYEQYALGEIDLETYRTRKAVYDTELVQAKNVHAVITAQTKQIKSDYEIKLKQQEIVQEVGNANMLTKALIDRLINKVYVFPGDRIEIEYATQDFLETKESEKEV